LSTPQDFDFDAWLDGAERPERSVTVYQKAGLIADLDALAERITNAEQDEDVDGPSMGGGVGKLRAEYAKLAQQFHESGLTVRVRAMDDHEKRNLRVANPDMTPTEFGFLVLSKAIVSPTVSAAQVKRLADVLGEVQFGFILTKFHQACVDAPEVSADFLPKPSTRGDGEES
jgi:hypothetical protein